MYTQPLVGKHKLNSWSLSYTSTLLTPCERLPPIVRQCTRCHTTFWKHPRILFPLQDRPGVVRHWARGVGQIGWGEGYMTVHLDGGHKSELWMLQWCPFVEDRVIPTAHICMQDPNLFWSYIVLPVAWMWQGWFPSANNFLYQTTKLNQGLDEDWIYNSWIFLCS